MFSCFWFLKFLVVLFQVTTSFGLFGFVKEPQTVIAIKERSVTLDCSSTGESGVVVSWLLDGRPLSVSGDDRRSQLINGSLLITRVIHTKLGRSDEGTYQCVLSKGSRRLISQKARLLVAYIDQDFNSNPLDQFAYVGDTIQFRCAIDALPSPTYSWYRDDQPIAGTNINILADGTVLEISPVRPADFGVTYKCLAKHAGGQALVGRPCSQKTWIWSHCDAERPLGSPSVRSTPRLRRAGRRPCSAWRPGGTSLAHCPA